MILLCLASSTTPPRNLLVTLAQYTVTHFRSSSWFFSSLMSDVMAYHVVSTAHSSFMIKLHDQAASEQAIESCLNDIDAWMLANMLKLNRDKTELLVIGPKHKVNPPIKGIHMAGDYIEVSNNARNIGVILVPMST